MIGTLILQKIGILPTNTLISCSFKKDKTSHKFLLQFSEEEVEKRGIPDSVDYTALLPPVKNQKGCGSCWTFGAVAALEYQINKNSVRDTLLYKYPLP